MRKTKSPILEAVRDTAKGLHQADVMEQITLREFDQLCLPPVEPLQPAQIKHIRETTRVSQAAFARLLNTWPCAAPGSSDRARFPNALLSKKTWQTPACQTPVELRRLRRSTSLGRARG